jgi:eukaryotic-like serine/threonine-protein kinase
MNLQIGSTVGDYQIVGILGAGGMGKVYKVRNVISDRIEAMKVLLPDLVAQAELSDRFLREIKTQASLEHPNIASLRTALRVDNQLLMLMEFVDGVTLEQKLKDGPLPVEQAVDYISQALSALDYAHQHGVIHRDIKPANMMLTPAGLVKLMDFGIAKGSGDQRLTMTGTTMGSLYYMSPEQIRGAANVDARADLYSVGVTLYELATGKRPFDGDSQFAIMSAHLEKMPVPPVEVDPRLPQALNDAILMSVAKDPAMRFQTAGAFRAALGSVLPAKQAAPIPQAAPRPPAQAITQPPPPPPIPRPMAPSPVAMAAAAPKSKRGLWMAAGALAAALGAIAVIEFGPWKDTKAQTPPSQAQVQPQPQLAAPAPTQTAAPAAVPPASQPTTQPASAPSQTPQQAAPAPTVAKSKASGKPAASQAVATSAMPGQVQPAQTGTQPTVQPPAPQPIQQPAQQQAVQPAPKPADPQPTIPSRAEMMASRERRAQLDARASGIHTTLQSLQRSQAASGLNLNARFTEPASMMDTYLKAASDALKDNDLASAKDFMDKAERQVEILEKLLNR